MKNMDLETVTKLAAEVEASADGWRPVKMVRYDWGWRLHVELDAENTMSLAWYEPWATTLARRESEYADMPVIDLEINIY
jgi:hypothetical protein